MNFRLVVDFYSRCPSVHLSLSPMVHFARIRTYIVRSLDSILQNTQKNRKKIDRLGVTLIFKKVSIRIRDFKDFITQIQPL